MGEQDAYGLDYGRLAARFDRHFRAPQSQGGATYVTGQQVAERLNQVLGPGGWSFTVREHGYDQASDEVWVLGRLEVLEGGVAREQFGSQRHNRRKVVVDKQTGERTGGEILDYGFDLKGAATDALKKCASLIGVGLYLSEKGSAAAPPRAEVLARWERLLRDAERAGCAPARAVDLAQTSTAQLGHFADQLAARIQAAPRDGVTRGRG